MASRVADLAHPPQTVDWSLLCQHYEFSLLETAHMSNFYKHMTPLLKSEQWPPMAHASLCS